MIDYEIQAPSRVCAATQRELKPGESYWAVLTEQSGKLVRRDFAAEAWSGPPPGAIAYWRGKVPVAGQKPRNPVINEELLVDCLERLKDRTEPEGQNFRYVVALLLMRRKRFKFEDAGRDDQGRDVLIVRDVRSGAVHTIVDPHVDDEQLAAVQADVFRVLGWE
ncbi:MAG: hypothetical protein RMJ56_14090 [Gemmataceae bacterium]|nr:hypothetical protein [Gemmata sp.]MDW8198723.1 hypothetical protein [Gemmataceae bacterium]